MLKKNPQKPIALVEKNQSVNILQLQQEQVKKSVPKSHRKLTPSSAYNKKSYFSKQKSHIPTLLQAKQRQKQIIKFHNRNFHQRQKRLQQIFKQNCRIYIQLNKQKSYYAKNFNKQEDKKSYKSHNVSCSDYNTTKIFQQQKLQKFIQDSEVPTQNKFQRRYSLSIARPNKQRQLQQKKKCLFLGNNIQSDMALQLKRYQKNKTQILPRKNIKVNIQNAKDLYSFIESKSNRNSDLSLVKNPVHIRFKRRPSSGFRC